MEGQSWLYANFVSYVIQGRCLTRQLLLLRHLPKAIGLFICICSHPLFSEKITSLSYAFSETTFLNYAQSLFWCNSSNFAIGASRGESYRRSALKDNLYHGLLVSLYWEIPFLWLIRPPGLLASVVSCRVQKRRWFLWTSPPVRSCNVSLALYHVRWQKLTMVICCLDMLYLWFRDFHPNHIWRRQTDRR